jgi:hypothetical protein
VTVDAVGNVVMPDVDMLVAAEVVSVGETNGVELTP